MKTSEDFGQIARNKLKYLHYLNKMIEKCKVTNFFFSDVSNPATLFYLQILLVRNQPLEIMVKSWKISFKEIDFWIW